MMSRHLWFLCELTDLMNISKKRLNTHFSELDNIVNSKLHKDKHICKNCQINLTIMNNKGNMPTLWLKYKTVAKMSAM